MNQKTTLNTYRIDCTGCKTCARDYQADNLRHAIARLSGVLSVKVDEVTGKVAVEYETQKINLARITDRIQKLGYRVEVLSPEGNE